MKRNKFLAGLCIGSFLLSAAPSFALNQIEYRVQKIVDYLKRVDKLEEVSPSWSGSTTVHYGVHYAIFSCEHGRLKIDVQQKRVDSLLRTEFLLYDNPNNGYGSFDEIVDWQKKKFPLKRMDLTKEERMVWDGLYERIIDKFYYERQDKMKEIELLEEALNVLRNKQNYKED